MATARLYFDYIDPGSLLLERRLSRAGAARGISVERMPFEVRPPPEPLIDPGSDTWGLYWAGMLQEAVDEGLELTTPTRVPWTRKAHELALHSKEKGRYEAVHTALFRGLLEKGLDLGRVDVLVELARECGLDPGETKAALDVDRYTAELERLRRVGTMEGVRGVPTLVFEDRVLEGVPSIAELDAFLDERDD